MAATTNQITALSNDGAFRQRMRALILQIAAQVYNEDPATVNHALRKAFAIRMIQSAGYADTFINLLVTRTNLAQSNITYSFLDNQIQTDASDAAILSQIATDWEMLAGV